MNPGSTVTASSSSSATRLALLAFGLTSWIQSSAQLRGSFIRGVLFSTVYRSNSRGIQGRADPLRNLERVDSSAFEQFTRWFKGWGKVPDAGEMSAIGLVELLTACAVFRAFDIKPILPLILNPLSSIPFPRKLDITRINWSVVVLTTVALSLAHEVERASVIFAVDQWRARRAKRARRLHAKELDVGLVIVKGADRDRLHDENQDNDDEEVKCLICSDVDVDTDAESIMSKSISALSESSTDPSLSNSLGPMEAFCTLAPQKHLAHRVCFLTWHDAYLRQEQQERPRRPLPVTVVTADQSVPTSERGQMQTRVTTILRAAAGFEYLLEALRFSDSTTTPPNVDHHPQFMLVQPELDALGILEIPLPAGQTRHRTPSTFTLKNDRSTSDEDARTLGTLTTSAPPCPACRSAVQFRFVSAPPPPASRTSSESVSGSPAYRRVHKVTYVMWRLLGAWARIWGAHVTGRTLLLRIATQLAFVGVLYSMAKSGARTRRFFF